MSKESMKNMNKFVLPSIAILWSGITLIIMELYARSILGPTPIYLPIFFAVISFLGVIAIMCVWERKFERLFLVVSGVIFLMSFIWHMKHFLNILYVT